MNRVRKFQENYWFAPAPLVNLSVVRIFAVFTQLMLLLFKDGGIARQKFYASLPGDLYEPIPMLLTFIWPLGFDYRPSIEVLEFVWWIAVIAGFFALVGLRTNFALALLAVGSVFLKAHEWSYGSIHHPPAIMMVALGALAISPSGRVLSLDALLRRDKHRISVPFHEQSSTFARWPLLMLGWFFVTMYLSAAFSKMINTDFAWANGYTLQYFLIMDGMRWASPLAVWASQFHVLILLCSWVVIIFQLTFAAAMIFPALRWIYVPIGLALHGGIYLTLKAPFFEWMALYSIFIPWAAAFAYVAKRRGEKSQVANASASLKPV